MNVAFKPVDEKEPPRTISNETLFIGLASKTVPGVIGPYDIDEISDKLVKFSIGTRDQGDIQRGSSTATRASWRQRSTATSRSAEVMLSPASLLSPPPEMALLPYHRQYLSGPLHSVKPWGLGRARHAAGSKGLRL